MNFATSSTSSRLSFIEPRDPISEPDSDDEGEVSTRFSFTTFSSGNLSPVDSEMASQSSQDNQQQLPGTAGAYHMPAEPGAVPSVPGVQAATTQASSASAQHSNVPSALCQHAAPTRVTDIQGILAAPVPVGSASLPPPYSRDAPRTFKGSYAKVEGWVHQYEKLLAKYGIKDGKDQCEGILDYCSLKVKRTIRSLPSFKIGNWPTFKQDVLKLYDAERARQQFQPSDIQSLARKQASKPIDNLSKWLRYCRRFQERGGELVPTGKMTAHQYATYFWLGIPEALRKLLEIQLCAKFPLRSNKEPYAIPEVCEAAEQFFSRSHFASTVPDAEAFGTLPREEDSGEDSDTEDDSDSDLEEIELWKKLFKGRRKERTKGRENREGAAAPNPPSSEVTSRERVRTTQFAGPQAEVAELIGRLNSMQLENPDYGTLYYRAIKLDPSSRECILRTPALAFIPTAATYAPTPPSSSLQRPQVPITTDGRAVRLVPFDRRPPGAPRFTCNACGSPDHKIFACPEVSERQRKGDLKYDAGQRKFVTPDGRVIERVQGENLLQALNRMLAERPSKALPSSSQSMLLTVAERARIHLARSHGNSFVERCSEAQQQESEVSESEEVEEESEEEEEDESEEVATSEEEASEDEAEYSSPEAEYAASLAAVLAAERSTSQGRESRNRTQAGPSENFRDARTKRRSIPPMRADGTRPSLRDVVRPAKRTPTSRTFAPRVTAGSPPPRSQPSEAARQSAVEPASIPESQPRHLPIPASDIPMDLVPSIEITPKLKGTDIPFSPKPYDARLPPSRRAVSLEPDLLRSSQAKPPRNNKGTHVRFTEPETPQSMETQASQSRVKEKEKVERKSDLARRVDKRNVMEKLLGTQIQMSLGEVLGTSRELSTALHDLSKVRLQAEKLPPPKSSRVNTITSKATGRTILTKNAELIEFYLHYNGRRIKAILDTGSQINVLSSQVYEDIIRLPVDLRERMTMSDANGGEGLLHGALDDLPLRCGSVETRGFFFIGENTPFQLLLGMPWIQDNAVSIDERQNETYLVYKDSETWTPTFEMLVSTRHGQHPQYRLGPRHKNRLARSFHLGMSHEVNPDEVEIVSDSEVGRQRNSEEAAEVPESTLTSGSGIEDLDEENDIEIQERQPDADVTPPTSPTLRLRPATWLRRPDVPRDVEENDSNGSTVRDLDLEDSTTQDLAESSEEEERREPDSERNRIRRYVRTLLFLWLRIAMVASSVLLLWLCQIAERLIGEEQEDIREPEESSSSASNDHISSAQSLLFRMASTAVSPSLDPEAAPPVCPTPSSQDEPPPTYPGTPSSAPTAPSMEDVPPPPPVSHPGPIHHPRISPNIPPLAAISAACASSSETLQQFGRIPTRPMILCSPQTYFLHERIRPGIGRSQLYTILNAGLIVYNPLQRRSSHQMGHVYMEFFPRSTASPVAPRAARHQHFNYLFELTILPSGRPNRHNINPDDRHLVPVDEPATLHDCPKRSQTTTQPTGSDEEETVDEITIEVEVTSDMDVDSPSGSSSSSSSGEERSSSTAPTTPAVDATPDPRGRPVKKPIVIRPPTPLPMLPPSPQPTSPTSLAMVPLRRMQTRDSMADRGRPRLRYPDAPPVIRESAELIRRLCRTPISEMVRKLVPEAVGRPIFTISDEANDLQEWQFTSIFRLNDRGIISEPKRVLVGRLTNPFKTVMSEVYYHFIEEKAEEFWQLTPDPDTADRSWFAERFAAVEKRQLLKSKFRYRVGVARGEKALPTILSADSFDTEEWEKRWLVQGADVLKAGRWTYRAPIFVFIYQELFRAMIMFTEFLMLQGLDHIFRARYHAFKNAPRFVSEKFGPLLGNKLLPFDARLWMIAAWELAVFMGEVELSSLFQTVLRVRFFDNDALEYLHAEHLLPELPKELPGTYTVHWEEIMRHAEDYDSFVTGLFSDQHVPILSDYVVSTADVKATTVPQDRVSVINIHYPISNHSSTESLASTAAIEA